MCNANESIITKVEELMDLRKLAEELQNQMDAITDETLRWNTEDQKRVPRSPHHP